MFQIINPGAVTPTPWKNGTGLTREIARADDAGGMLWRISIADVGADGPFSLFEGMSRILTVIEGAGMDLVMPDQSLTARPWQPVRFSGNAAVQGRLAAGPIRDLNLIFDTARVRADVRPVHGPASIDVGPARQGLFVLRGHVSAAQRRVPPGWMALDWTSPVVLDAQAAVLHITTGPVG